MRRYAGIAAYFFKKVGQKRIPGPLGPGIFFGTREASPRSVVGGGGTPPQLSFQERWEHARFSGQCPRAASRLGAALL